MHATPFPRPAVLLPLLCLAALAGCASTQPIAYTGLQSAPQLRPNLDDDTGRIPYRVASHRDWSQYTKVILDPIVIYSGPDHQFEDVPEAQRRQLAGDMRRQFTARLATRFQIVAQPAPATLRLRVTLTGARLTTRGLSTFTRFDIGGGPYNLVQGIRGKEGTFTGSVSYAVEIFDAVSNQLLDAFVTKQYPNALNIGATFGTLDAAQAGIEKGAQELTAQFQ